MNLSRFILVASLIANGTLLAFVFLSLTPATRSSSAMPRGEPGPSHTETTALSAQPGLSSSPKETIAKTASSTLWDRLHTDDIDQLMARLKAAGFSFKERSAIIGAVGTEKFSAARAALRATGETVPYWKPPVYSRMENPEDRAKEVELMEAESKFYRTFFQSPEAVAENEDAADMARQRYGNLPIEKLQQLMQTQNDYDELRQNVYKEMQTRARPQMTPEDRQKIALLDTELQRDIQHSLTPDQFDEYLLRESRTASRIRSQFELLRLTEAEYKALFALQHPIDEQFRGSAGDEKTREAYAEAQKNLAPQIKAALGDDRYADYQQLTESGNDKTARLMVRLDLPLATVGKINSVRDDATERARTIRADNTLTPVEKNTRLTALAQETEAELTSTLGGPRGLEAYAELKGDWLRALQPKPAAP